MPPLVSELQHAGLGHLAPKLVYNFACGTVEQLLRLTSAQLETLLDAVNLIPGRRQALIDFLKTRRRLGGPSVEAHARHATRTLDQEWSMIFEVNKAAFK